MAWWKVALIIIAALFVLLNALVIFVANVQIDMFLKPGSYWWSKAGWDTSERVPKDEFEKREIENEKAVRQRACEWHASSVHEDWYEISDDDLKLHAVFYPSGEQDSHLWAVCIHGYRGTLENIQCYGVHFAAKGYNVLLPENRTSGQSEGTYIGMGWLDKNDILLWLNRIVEKDSEAKIVLLGESMGSAAVMMTSGQKVPSNLKCIVSDCGYTSVWNQFAYIMNNSMPLKPFPFLYAASLFSKIRLGYGFKQASSTAQLAKSVTPTIFMHGEIDDFVPPFMVKQNYEALKLSDDKKEMHIFPHASHCQSQFYDEELYWNTVWNFVEKFL